MLFDSAAELDLYLWMTFFNQLGSLLNLWINFVSKNSK